MRVRHCPPCSKDVMVCCRKVSEMMAVCRLHTAPAAAGRQWQTTSASISSYWSNMVPPVMMIRRPCSNVESMTSGRWTVPTYDYRCEANGRVVEVRHHMNEAVSTWGELCTLAGIEAGDTPAGSPVHRLITGGQVVRRSSLGDAQAPACNSGPCCGGGVCGLDRY